MKNNFLSCIFFVFKQHVNAHTANELTDEGTSANTYQIATLENLYWLIWDSSQWNKHFIQTSDINVSVTSTRFSGEGFLTTGGCRISFDVAGVKHNERQLNSS